MHDGGKIIAGLVAFLALVTFPLWFTLANGRGAPPTLAKPVRGEHCVEATTYMRSQHMDLLNVWRDAVVREDLRTHASRDFPGESHEMSLTNTCLSCHADKTQFCDQCHNYLGVSPYCWDCHVDPKEVPHG
jgi:hypothetical protein